jgi:hypothetical protein
MNTISGTGYPIILYPAFAVAKEPPESSLACCLHRARLLRSNADCALNGACIRRMVRNVDGPAQSARWRNTISVSGIDGTGNDLDIAHPKLRMVHGLVDATTI